MSEGNGALRNSVRPLDAQPPLPRERLIIEDRCWHIEIQQTYKLLPNQDSASTFGDPFRSFICSLESWF